MNRYQILSRANARAKPTGAAANEVGWVERNERQRVQRNPSFITRCDGFRREKMRLYPSYALFLISTAR